MLQWNEDTVNEGFHCVSVRKSSFQGLVCGSQVSQKLSQKAVLQCISRCWVALGCFTHTTMFKCCRFAPKVARKWPKIARKWPKIARKWPKLARKWPKMARKWPKTARKWPKTAKTGLKFLENKQMGLFRTNDSCIQSLHTYHMPYRRCSAIKRGNTMANTGAKWAKPWRNRVKNGQKLGKKGVQMCLMM